MPGIGCGRGTFGVPLPPVVLGVQSELEATQILRNSSVKALQLKRRLQGGSDGRTCCWPFPQRTWHADSTLGLQLAFVRDSPATKTS